MTKLEELKLKLRAKRDARNNPLYQSLLNRKRDFHGIKNGIFWDGKVVGSKHLGDNVYEVSVRFEFRTTLTGTPFRTEVRSMVVSR